MRRFLVAALLLTVTYCFSQGQLPSKGKPTKEPSKQTQDNAGKAQAAPVPVTLAQVKALVQQEKGKKEKLDIPPEDWWARGLGIVTAVVGIVQSFYIWKTLQLTKQSADAATKSAEVAEKAVYDSKESGAEHLRLTEITALAAKKSAEVAERTLVSFERPWMTFETPLIVERIEAIDGLVTLKIKPIAINSGKSPALMESFESVMIQLQSPPSQNFAINLLGTMPVTSIIPANGRCASLPHTVELDRPESPRILYVVCHLSYKDLFEGPHESFSIWQLTSDRTEFVSFPDATLNRHT